MDASPQSERGRPALGRLAVLLILLLAYRAYGPHWETRPTEASAPSSRRVDLNTADRVELLQIPGVGPSLADAILMHRTSVGPFEKIDQLDRVHGVGNKTLEKLRPWVTAQPTAKSEIESPDTVERLERKTPSPAAAASASKKTDGAPVDINHAAIEELQTLPGIGPKLADRIVQMRKLKPFDNLDDLKRVGGIGPKTLEKLRPRTVFKREP